MRILKVKYVKIVDPRVRKTRHHSENRPVQSTVRDGKVNGKQNFGAEGGMALGEKVPR